MDNREYKSAERIINGLRKKGIGVIPSQLDYGDYFIPGSNGKGALIERKTVLDLSHTIKEGRWFEQLRGLKSSENGMPCVIIEGSYATLKKFTKWNPEHLNYMIASTVWSWQIPVMWSRNVSETVAILSYIAKNIQRENELKIYPVNYKPKFEDLNEASRYVIESLPLISAVRADALLKHFKSVRGVFENIEKIDEVEGIGSKIKEKVIEVFNHKYGGVE
ncbi:MAG: ERCC4 domain-containing protein [Nitrososphaerales archaeon]